MFESCIFMFHIENCLLNFIILTDQSNTVRLQLLESVSDLSLLILPTPVNLLDVLLDIRQLSLRLVQHVLENLVVNLPTFSPIVEHQVEVHDPGSLMFQLRLTVVHTLGPGLDIRHLAWWGGGQLVPLHAQGVHGLSVAQSLKLGLHQLCLKTGSLTVVHTLG